MKLFRASVLHPVWMPAWVILTLVMAVPRARDAGARMAGVSRAAGVFGRSTTDPNEFGDTRFRWMRPSAALHEPVRGERLLVPLIVERRGLEAVPLTLDVTVAGVATPVITLRRSGWHTLSFDLVEILGESRARSIPSVTLAFTFGGLTPEMGMPIVGLGDVHWSSRVR